MYIIIVGAGELGYYLAQILLEEDHTLLSWTRTRKNAKKYQQSLT